MQGYTTVNFYTGVDGGETFGSQQSSCTLTFTSTRPGKGTKVQVIKEGKAAVAEF